MSDRTGAPRRKPRVLVTRASGQASALADELAKLGAEPVCIPILEITEPDSFAALDTALATLATFDWLIFTSANGVTAFIERARAYTADLTHLQAKIAAIGSATSAALKAQGLRTDLIPPTAVAESLAEALLPHARHADGSATGFLLIRAQEGREHLPETLQAAGAEVIVAAAYKTRTPTDSIAALQRAFANEDEAPEGITFTSSSSAKHFFALLAEAGLEFPPTTAIASIGPITSDTLRELNHPPHIEAQEATVRTLAEAATKYLEGNGAG